MTRISSSVKMGTAYQFDGDVMLTLTVWTVATRRTVTALPAVTVLQMSFSATTHYANRLLGNVMEKMTVETTQMRTLMSAESSSVLPRGLSAARMIASVCRCQRGAMVSITVETTQMKLTARPLQWHVRKMNSCVPTASASAPLCAATFSMTVKTMALTRLTARQTQS